jgi:RNA polymerase sigma factor (sigma-70 family)
MTDDAELLTRYARDRDEGAFRVLVERYVDLVFSAALRQVHDSHIAQDVTQMVFLRLARKASSLPEGVVLAGWLHADTRLTALQVLRAERRRVAREEAIPMEKSESTEGWEELRPVVDEALAELEQSERDAVLLRFFGDRSFADVGSALRLSPDAARMRVNRALEKLREVLGKRGITTTAAALSAALLANSIQAAPFGMAAKVLSGLVLTSGASSRSLAQARNGWKAFFAGGVALVLLVGGFALSKGRKESKQTQAPDAPAVLAAAPLAEVPKEPVVETPAPLAKATTKTLKLKVIEGQTGLPLAGVHVEVSAFTDLQRYPRRQLQTDEDGTVQITFPAVYERDFHHRLTLSKDAHVARVVSWSVFQHDTIDDLPAEYTATMDRGVQIGGIVRNPAGEGINGVKVVFCGESPVGIPPRERDTTMWNYHTEMTGADGRWRCDHIRPGFGSTQFRLEHPQFRTVTYGCNETDQPSQGTILLPQTDYLAGKAEMRMQPGLLLGGTVANAAGQPIAGASVTRDRDWNRQESTVTTDGQGAFEFHDVEPGSIMVTVQATSYAPETKTVSVDASPAPVRFELAKSLGLRGNVVDENGDPAPKAEVSVENDERYRPLLRWSVRTDDLGNFFWDSSPNRPFKVNVFAYGFERTNAMVQPGNDLQVIALTRSTQASGNLVRAKITVIDAASQKAIDGAEINVIESHDRGGVSPHPAGRTAAGVFTYKSFSPDAYYQFEARAEGYLPEKTAPMMIKTNLEVQLALRKADSIRGVVIGPDSEPVAGAEIALCTGEKGALIANRRLVFLDNSIVVRSDQEGKFLHQAQSGAHTICAVHRSGFAKVRLSQWQNGGPIQLRPWGRIAGLVTMNGEPARNAELGLFATPMNGNEREVTVYDFHTNTDAEGRFAFEDVPPMEVKLARMIPNGSAKLYSHSVPVDVQAEATTEVNYALQGRTVRGKLKAEGLAGVDWKTQVRNASFNVDQGALPYDRAGNDPASRKKLYAQFWESEAGKEWERKNNSFAIRVQGDGSFEAEAVPPGKYTISIMIGGAQRPDMPFGRTIANLRQPITIPEGNGDFDAGELVVKGR